MTILVSGYFSGDGQERKLDYFERLDEALRKRGARVLLLNLAPKPLACRCESISIPHFIPYVPLFRRMHLLSPINLDGRLDEAFLLEAGDLGMDKNTAALKLTFLRAFVRSILRRRRPVLCVLWHQFNGPHHAIVHLLKEAGLPYCFAEYGQLSGTIAYDQEGQMAESWVTQSSEEFKQLPVDAEQAKRVERYFSSTRDERLARHAQPENRKLVELMEEQRSKGRTVLFFAGENLYRSGVLPSGFPRAKIHSPWFRTSDEALHAVADLAKRNNWFVVFKPHPLATQPEAVPDAPNENVMVIRDANVFDCIEKADVTLTIVSQVSYLALQHNRPVVMLGRNTLSGMDCTYELDSVENLENTIRRAIANGLTSQQQEAWRKHAEQMATHYLYSFDSDVETVLGRGVKDAADFLLEMVDAESTSDDSVQGSESFSLWGTDSSIASFWKVRLPYAILSATAPMVAVIVSALPRAAKDRLLGAGRWF